MTIGTPMVEIIEQNVLAERRRIVALIDSYETQTLELVRMMAHDGVGDAHGPMAQLDMLRLLRAAIDK